MYLRLRFSVFGDSFCEKSRRSGGGGGGGGATELIIKLKPLILKAILGIQHFCSFGAMLFIINLLIKTDFTVICIPYMFGHVCYEPFSFKKLQILKISDDNWFKCVLSEIHVSKIRFK